MIRLRRKGKPIFILMILLTCLISVPLKSAMAALIETETVIAPDRATDTRVLLNQLMAREDVRMSLLTYGIDPVEAKARINSLTDLELAWIAEQMNELPAGGMNAITPPWYMIAIPIVALILLIVVLALVGLKLADSSEKPKATNPVKPSEGNVKQDQPQSEKLADPAVPLLKSGETWTGKWRVQGSLYASGLWALKQDRQTVVSTDESYYSVKGTVTENKLEGTYSKNLTYKFSIVISPDGMSFEGHATDKEGTRQIQGTRIK